MTIRLHLDTNAVDALFPEGTQARVELQQAVIAEIIRRKIKPGALGESVAAQIERARSDALDAIERAKAEMADKVLRDQGVTKDHWGCIELKNEAKATIDEAARQAIRDEIEKAIREQVKSQVEKLKFEITVRTEGAISRMIDSEIRNAVKARIAAVMEQIGKGAV